MLKILIVVTGLVFVLAAFVVLLAVMSHQLATGVTITVTEEMLREDEKES